MTTDQRQADVKSTPKPNGLRDSIVMRLRAHDAAVRSTLSNEAPAKDDTKEN